MRSFRKLSAPVLAAAVAMACWAGSAAADELSDAALRIAAGRLGVPQSELVVDARGQAGNIHRFKIEHKGQGRIETVSLDARAQEVAEGTIRGELMRRRGRDFAGKLEGELKTRLDTMRPTDRIAVIVWGKPTGRPPQIDRRKEELGQAGPEIERFKQFHRNAMQGLRQKIEHGGGQVLEQTENAPLLVAEMSKNLALDLAERGDAEALYLNRAYKDELNVSAKAIDANTVVASGFTGTGVKVGVVESGAIYFGHASLADGIKCKPSSASSAHTTGVAGIIASTHATYKGVAPGAPALLSGNAGSYDDDDIIDCTEWAINNGARVINYSFGVDSSSSMVALDRYVDYVVRYRAVTMVKSAGNRSNTCPGTDQVTSPGKGWNIITVGNYDDRNTIANGDDVISGDSCFKDPASPHGDRQKPEVAAPGTSITTLFCTSSTTCTGTGSGTSFAAPHATGCAALIMDRNESLKWWPESVKAVMMASAVVNPEGATRLSDKDGAGGIECDSAVNVTAGVGGGEAHGLFTAGDFPKTFTFAATAGQTVRVAIAWDSNTNQILPPTTDVLNADLDLQIRSPSNAYVTSSASWDNSFEIVEFTAPATGTYTARVAAHRFDGTSEFLGYAHWKGVREDSR